MTDCKTCAFPKLTEQAKNVGLSLFNVMTQAFKTGQVLAAQGEIENRIKICNHCKMFKENRCTACGCFIALKAGLAAEKCPKGFW